MSGVIKASSMGGRPADEIFVIDPDEALRAQLGIPEPEPEPEPDPGPSPEELAQAAAEQIVSAARAEAAALVEAARNEADDVRDEARKDGLRVAMEEAEAYRASLAAEFEAAIAGISRRFDDFWANVEPEVVKLSLEMGRKVIQHEIDERDDFILGTIRAGLRQLRDRQELKIRVNPDDYEFVRAKREEVVSSCDGIRSLEIIDDRRIERGGCLIESSNGSLDARMSTQIGEIEKTILEMIDGS